MPLGNHTSQFFANIYLNELDQFVKHNLKAKHYIRYVDDFVILSNSNKELQEYKKKIDLFLREKLSLELHPDKSKILNIKNGITFLGFRIFQYHRLPRKANIRKFRGKLSELEVLYQEGQVNREQVVEAIEGWMAYAKQSDTYKYRMELLRGFNRHFPIKKKKEIIRSKKIKNFFRKYYASKLEFSCQRTLLLLRKRLTISEIAKEREIKEATVWAHCINLIEHGHISVWSLLSRKRIVYILQRIKNYSENLKEIKSRLYDKRITYDEIVCVRAHLIMKSKIKDPNPLQLKSLLP